MSVRLGILHQLEEFLEEVVRIVRTGRRFGVVLNTERRHRPVLQAFDRVIVQIHVRNIDVVQVETLRIHSETMILRRDFHLLARDVQDRVISAMMPELQLVRLAAQSEPHDLMA